LKGKFLVSRWRHERQVMPPFRWIRRRSVSRQQSPCGPSGQQAASPSQAPAAANPAPPPDTAAQRKLNYEAEKAELEVKELKKPYWRRKEFFGFQGSILVGMLGVIGTQLVTYYTSRKHMEDELAGQLVANTIESLNTEVIEHRHDAGRRLGAFVRDDTFQRIREAYMRSLADERKKGNGAVAPALRIGAVEAVGMEGAPWRHQDAGVAFLREALESDTSPLVRHKAAQTLIDISAAHMHHVDDQYEKEAKRLRIEVKEVIEGGGAMVLLPAMRVVVGRDGGDASERPAHERAVRSFRIDKRPVSYAQWNRVMNGQAPALEQDAYSSRRKIYSALRQDRAYSDVPVTGVSFEQAIAYCTVTGKRRLPTEVEMEAAARGVSGWPFAWGSRVNLVEPRIKALNAAWNRAHDGVVPIKVIVDLARVQKDDVSAFGVEGLTMSVKHWTHTEWTQHHEKTVNGEWRQAPCKSMCVVKGGAGFDALLFNNPERFWGSRRQAVDRTNPDDNLGFRCASEAK